MSVSDDWEDANLREPPPDDADEVADGALPSGGFSGNSAAPTPASRDSTGAPAGVSSEDRSRALKDPVVQKVMELFDATLTNLRRTTPASDG